jgi:hypothetical protein
MDPEFLFELDHAFRITHLDGLFDGMGFKRFSDAERIPHLRNIYGPYIKPAKTFTTYKSILNEPVQSIDNRGARHAQDIDQVLGDQTLPRGEFSIQEHPFDGPIGFLDQGIALDLVPVFDWGFYG